jgi:hypothetical protein
MAALSMILWVVGDGPSGTAGCGSAGRRVLEPGPARSGGAPSADFRAAADAPSMATMGGREVAAGCDGVSGFGGGAAPSDTVSIKDMMAGATWSGGPACDGRWRFAVSHFRVTAVAGCPTAGVTCAVPTAGSGKNSGTVWGSGNVWGIGNVRGAVWGIGTVGVAGAGAEAAC